MAEGATIVVETRWPLGWFSFFFLFRTTVTIDGSATELPWGRHEFPVDPGAHDVRVSLGRGLGLRGFPPDMNPAELRVEVAQGEVARLRYRPSLSALMPGKLVAKSI